MPESNNSNDPRVTVAVPAPGTGAEVAVTSEAGGNLKFDFDPAQATATRPDGSNDLVFELDGGGRVVIGGFFEVGDNTLPDLTLPDGTVVAATDFFQGSDLDMTTAAGPGAGAPGSGGTNYDDDGGALLAGLDKYGALGTDYWARATDTTEEADPLLPTVDFTISINTNPDQPDGPIVDEGGWVSGRFQNMVFEDGQPNQHLTGQISPESPYYDEARVPGILEMDITPGAGTTITSITLTGFTEGTVITIDGVVYGDGPLAPGAVVNLTHEQVLSSEIAVWPPMNNLDEDMTITATVVGTANGRTATATDTFTLVVDAVADLPVGLDGSASSVNQTHADTDSAEKEEIRAEADTVSFNVKVEFTDLDGSETHYVVLNGVPDGWGDPISLPTGWSIVSPGDPDYPDAYAGNEQQYVIKVPGDVSPVQGSVTFEPGEWTNARDSQGVEHKSGPLENGVDITIKAASWENNTTDDEPVLANNFAETEAETVNVSIREDLPKFTEGRITITSDETPGDQIAQEEKFSDPKNEELREAVETALGKAGLGDGYISAATDKISYNLFSDGAESGGKAGLAFAEYDGAESGWTTTGGSPIFLFTEDGVVVGRVGEWNESANGGLGAWEAKGDGTVALAVVITGAGLKDGPNSADITFIQYESLKHLIGGDNSPDELMSTGDDREELKIGLVLTDNDGDKTTTTVYIDVHDDAPTLEFGQPGTDTLVGEGVGGTIDPGQSVSLEGMDFDGGADGIKSVLIEGPEGASVTLFQDVDGLWSAEVPGYGTLTLDPATGKVTLDVDPAHADGAYTWKVTITDGDGDTVSDEVEYTVKVSDPFADKFDGFIVDESFLNGRDSQGNPLQHADGSYIVGTAADPDNENGVKDAEDPVTVTQAQLNAFTITGPDGVEHNVKGEMVDGKLSIDGEYGTLTVTVAGPEGGPYQVGTEYELKSNFAGHERNAADADYVGSDDRPGVDGAGKGDWNETEQGADKFEFKVGDNPPTVVGVDILDDGLGQPGKMEGGCTFEETQADYNVVLCLDLSTSMLGTPANSNDRITQNSSAADFEGTRLYATIVAGLATMQAYAKQAGAEHVDVSFVGFGVDAVPFGPFTSYQAAYDALADMIEGFTVTLNADGTHSAAKNSSSGVWPTGGTDYTKGLDALTDLAKAAVADPGEARIYFLSDGEPYPTDAHSSDTWTKYMSGQGQGGLSAEDMKHLELYTVGIHGVSGTNFNGVTKDLSSEITNPHVDIPKDATIKDFIDALIETVGGLDGTILLPTAADGVIDQDGIGKAFVQAVELLGKDGEPVAGKGGPISDVEYNNGIPSAEDGAIDTESVTVKTQYGDFIFRADGTYTYQPSAEGLKGLPKGGDELNFRVTFMDADGDTVQYDFNYSFEGKKVDSGLEIGSPKDDTITVDDGLGAGYLIIGDKPGTEIVETEKDGNYNISLILDLSGSMNDKFDGTSLLAIAKEALESLADQLAGHKGTVNLQLVTFNTHGAERFAVDDFNGTKLNQLLDIIANLGASGGTNYEAGFNEAYDWLSAHQGLQGDFTDKVFFLTDGDPTYYYSGAPGNVPTDKRGDPSTPSGPGNTTNAAVFAESLAAYKRLLEAGDDVQVHAIGLGDESTVTKSILEAFDNTHETGTGGGTGDYRGIEFEKGEVDIISSAEELEYKFQEAMSETVIINAGADTITGSSYDDIIFGDQFRGIINGETVSGYDNVAAAIKAAGGLASDPSVADVMDYIKGHLNDFNVSHKDDKGDEIRGGEGNDTIFGGGGNDLIYGGTGDDVMFGGAGADTFAWTAGDLTAGGADKVMDFNIGDGDKLRFEDVLGESQDLGIMFAANELDAKMVNGHLELTMGGQKVEVTFDGPVEVNNQTYADLNTFNEDAALMQQLLTLITSS